VIRSKWILRKGHYVACAIAPFETGAIAGHCQYIEADYNGATCMQSRCPEGVMNATTPLKFTDPRHALLLAGIREYGILPELIMDYDPDSARAERVRKRREKDEER
jgi:hypothetical protein